MKNLKIKVKENPTLIVDVHSLIYAISASQDIKINLQMPFLGLFSRCSRVRLFNPTKMTPP